LQGQRTSAGLYRSIISQAAMVVRSLVKKIKGFCGRMDLTDDFGPASYEYGGFESHIACRSSFLGLKNGLSQQWLRP
jgi:hypothetical protein